MAGANPANNRTDLYGVLGVSPSADHAQIRRAYVDLARQWHPDRYSAKPPSEAAEAETAMRRVNEAWEVLGNKQRRADYDRQLRPPTTNGQRPGMETVDGVTRIDPRLLDPEFLAARREAQFDQISTRTSLVLRAAPLLAVLGLLVAILVFTAYARDTVDRPTASTLPGPSLGAGIAANDCVVVTSGPALLEVPCTATADGRVIGARLPDGVCPLGTVRDVELSNGSIVCLANAG
ncbi:MAG: J domain-containing protein [Actinomycetota bacterium]